MYNVHGAVPLWFFERALPKCFLNKYRAKNFSCPFPCVKSWKMYATYNIKILKNWIFRWHFIGNYNMYILNLYLLLTGTPFFRFSLKYFTMKQLVWFSFSGLHCASHRASILDSASVKSARERWHILIHFIHVHINIITKSRNMPSTVKEIQL